jgi:hypothetical protein
MRYLLLLLISFEVFAYTKAKVSVSDYTFRRYILYQTKSIVQDYKSVQSHYLNKAEEFMGWRTFVFKSQKESRTVLKNCPKLITVECRKNILKMLKHLKELERDILSKYQQVQNISESERHIHLQIRNYNKLNQSVLKSITKLEMISNSTKYELKTLDGEGHSIIQVVDEVYFNLNEFLNSLIPSNYFSQFKNVFAHFINPLENQVYLNHNKDYLKYHLEDLNINWHAFNMYFTKIDKSTPKSIEVLLKTMNNRWNNILRLIIKQ